MGVGVGVEEVPHYGVCRVGGGGGGEGSIPYEDTLLPGMIEPKPDRG